MYLEPLFVDKKRCCLPKIFFCTSRLRSALTEAEKQLRIQSQVNSELKSLLVASVGEDIEARLDFLTQDKARLAADLIHYNNKISR